MNNSRRIKCYIKDGGSSERCLLNDVHTEEFTTLQQSKDYILIGVLKVLLAKSFHELGKHKSLYY